MDLVSISIGMGLVVSLLFTELFGLAAGGMVVPGYLALFVHQPLDVALTIAVAVVTYMLVQPLSQFSIVYGRRRTALTLLIGFLVGSLVRVVLVDTWLGPPLVAMTGYEVSVIGFIIPGLIAIWIDRQGLVETLCVMLTSAVVVRLLLILLGVDGLA